MVTAMCANANASSAGVCELTAKSPVEYLAGRIVGLDWDEPSLTLDTEGRRLVMVVPVSCRELVRALWGKDVVVTVTMPRNGDRDRWRPVAVEVDEVRRVANPASDFESSFGCFREDFANHEVQDYFRGLRGEV